MTNVLASLRLDGTDPDAIPAAEDDAGRAAFAAAPLPAAEGAPLSVGALEAACLAADLALAAPPAASNGTESEDAPMKPGEGPAAPARTGEGIRAATALPTDPMLAQQWHLGNVGGLLDLRVRGAWDPAMGAAYTGVGVRVVVIDDGFDYNHADLAAPYNTALDFDYDGVDFDPFGTASDAHGTAVTGIIGADNNGTGVVGIAFDSELVGYRTHGFINDFWLQNIRDAIAQAATNALADVANISQGIANDDTSEWGIGYNAVRFD